MTDGGIATAAATLSLINSTTLRDLRQVHAHMIKTKQTDYPALSGRLIATLCRRHRTELPYALSIFHRLRSPPSDPFTLNSILFSLLHSSPSLPLRFFSLHPIHPHPNSHSFPLLLKASSLLPSLPLGSALHAHSLKLQLDSHLHSHTALISLYSSLGDSHSALQLFDKSPHRRHIAVWNSLISGLAKSNHSKEALSIFRHLLLTGGSPPADETTITSALTAAAEAGTLGTVQWIHDHAFKNRITLGVHGRTALVDAYAKCGSIELARNVFDEMGERNVMSWTVMIRGLAMFGHGEEAVRLFTEMVSDDVKPDDVTFVAVLSACSHSGLVDEGRGIFSEMVSPKMEHYGCMVDLLSRAGLVDEALELIESMPMEADAALWGSLLSACRRNPANVELAEQVAGNLVAIEPDNDATYVLLSNIYAYNNRWDDVGRVRAWMKARGIRKTPGCSSVEVAGVVHEFIVGDKSHPKTDEIHRMVNEIESRVGEMGYVVDTSEVVLDLEEGEKRAALLLHSEKLALAFGLIGTDSAAPVRIVKNLRVCGDCHSLMKLASKAYGREIIVRDRNRFHRFKNGVCTCGDFW